MAIKKSTKSSKPPKKETETEKEKLQRLADTRAYAEESKRSNSPSASTRSNTSGRAFMKQQNKMLSATAGKADVSYYSLAMTKAMRERADRGENINTMGPIRTHGGKAIEPPTSKKPTGQPKRTNSQKPISGGKKPMSGGKGGNPKTFTRGGIRNKY